MGGVCSCCQAPDPVDPPQYGKATPPDSPAAASPAVTAPPIAVSPAEAAPRSTASKTRFWCQSLPRPTLCPRPQSRPEWRPKPQPVPDSGPCDFPVLVVPRMQRPEQQLHHRSPSAGEGYDVDPHHSATSSLQHSRGNSSDAAAPPPHSVIDDLVSTMHGLRPSLHSAKRVSVRRHLLRKTYTCC